MAKGDYEKAEQLFVKEYFNSFRNKIARCEDLFKHDYKMEAGILLSCYIDALATYTYGNKAFKNKEHFVKLLEEYSPYADELKENFYHVKISEAIYKLYRCDWVHNASSSKPTEADEFVIEVEDIYNPEGGWKSLMFPWGKMVETAYHIVDRLQEKAISGELPFGEIR
nr:hypothetical protein 22 [bacterium]